MSDARYSLSNDDETDTQIRLPRVVMPVTETHPALQAVGMAVPWRRISVLAVFFWLVSRGAYLLLNLIAVWLPKSSAASSAGMLGLWQRFDTNWYLGIARGGYLAPPQMAFFPLYPAIIRIVSVLCGGNLLVAGLLVSNVTCLTAMIAIGGLAARELRDLRAATFSMLALLLYPFSFFMTAAYTEGMFVTLAALCLLFARQGRWRLAAVMALLAGATRPTGVALIAPLAWEWLRQRQLIHPALMAALRQPGRLRVAQSWFSELTRSARAQMDGALAVVAVPFVLLALAIFSGIRFHHPLLIFFVRRDYWGLASAPLWSTLYREIADIFLNPIGSLTQFAVILDVVALAGCTVAIGLWARRTPVAFTLYTVGLLALTVAQPTASGLHALQGPGRYLVAALPLFLGLGETLERRPKVALALFALFGVLQCVIALQFLTGALVE